MQREYKYRAKRLDGKGWVYGMPVKSVNDRCYMIVGATEDAVNTSNEVDFMYVEVDPKTVCQYTGLKSNDGKYIYEGDVIRITEYDNIAILLGLSKKEIESTNLEDCKYQKRNSFIGEVVFSESCFFVGDTYFSAFHGDQRLSQPIFEIEVIGNVFDNPELL